MLLGDHMPNLLIIISHPEPVREKYMDSLRAQFPDMTINMVDHHSKVGPYIANAEILMTFAPMMADHVLQEGVNIKWIHALTTGTDGVDRLPSLRPEVVVTNTRGIHGPPMSEAALMSMLALARNYPLVLKNQERHVWGKHAMVTLLDGKTVGIFTMGTIGRAFAPKCKAMGMKVVGINRSLLAKVDGVDRILRWEEGLQALPEFDFVVSFIPSTPQTRGIAGAEFFAAMKPSAYFINLGRGEVVDEGALIDALKNMQIAGAALDVFHQEPLPPESPFWSAPNCIVTPHVGGSFDEYPQRALPIFYENMNRYLAGDYTNMINLVKH